MPVLGRATLELNADSAKLEQDLGRAVGQAAAFGTAIGQVMGQAISAGVSKLVTMVEKAIETGDELNKLSQKTGMTVEYLSQLRVGAELSGVSMNTLKAGVKGLYETLSQASQGSGKKNAAFEAIGLDIEKLRALKPDELFKVVTQRLSEYTDDANRAAIQTKILGKAGAELSPFINDLSKTTEIAKELGIVMDKDTAEAAERFKDNLTTAKIASEAMGMRIAQVLLPTLEKLSGYLVDNAKNTDRLDTAARAADAGLKLLATAGTIIATTFSVAGGAIGATAAILQKVATGQWADAARIARDSVVDMGTKIGEAVAQIEITWTEAANKAAAGGEANGKKLAAPALEAAEKIKKARKEADVEFQAFLKIHAIEEEANAATQKYYAAEGSQKEAARAKEIADRELMMKQVYAFGEAEEEAAMKAEQIAAGLGDVGKKAKETNDFSRQMGLTFQSAFEDAVVGGKKLSDVLKAVAQDVLKIFLRTQVTEPLGKAVSGFDWSKLFTGSSPAGVDYGAGAAAGFVGVFDRGTDYVPRDGMAFVHEGEKITPRSQNKRTEGVAIVQNISVDSRSDRASLMQAMRAAKDAAVAEIYDRFRRGDRA